jgi:Spy/CpxP family protein refolding chaperone
MKFKSIPLLAVTFAGTAMILAACQTQSSPTSKATGSSAQAQNTGMADASAPPAPDAKGSMQGAPLPPNINLTDEQKAKIKAILENYRPKMESILTDEQKNKLKEARQQGKTRTAMQSLNLTESQKQQLKDLRKSQRQEIENVLTTEQKQQLQQMRQNRQHKSKHDDEDSSASQGQ